MTNTWRDVARKDFEDAIRSHLIWGLIGVFVAFLAMSLLTAEQLFPDPVVVDAPKALAGVAMLAQLFVPGIALTAGYVSVVGERQTGSLRVLLSYPFSRRDVVAGKVVGRSLVTGTAMAVGFAVASVLVVVLYGWPDAGAFVGFVGSSVLLALAFTGLAVGGSAAAATRGGTRTLTVGSFMGMVFFWKPVVTGIYFAVTGSLPGVQAERWYFLLQRLNPLEAYRVLAGSAVGERVQEVPKFPLEDVPANPPPGLLDISNRIVGQVPFYLQDWFAVVILVAWGVAPILLGYQRFAAADLG